MHVPGRRGRCTIGVLMTPEKRWSQLARIDRRLPGMYEAEALDAAEANAKRLAMESEPPPTRVAGEPKSVDDPDGPVRTRADVERVVLEVLANLMGIPT